HTPKYPPRPLPHTPRRAPSFLAPPAELRRAAKCPPETASAIHSRPSRRPRAGFLAQCQNPSPSLPRLLASETPLPPAPPAPNALCSHSVSAPLSPRAHPLSSTMRPIP